MSATSWCAAAATSTGTKWLSGVSKAPQEGLTPLAHAVCRMLCVQDKRDDALVGVKSTARGIGLGLGFAFTLDHQASLCVLCVSFAVCHVCAG